MVSPLKALKAVGCVQETLRALVARKEEEDGKDEDANAQLPGKIPCKNDHDGGGAEELLSSCWILLAVVTIAARTQYSDGRRLRPLVVSSFQSPAGSWIARLRATDR
ncbi:hypothetical protein GN244_ATG19947 [Phytophthora infestans]|uniref:Uncharacterized protein n=1 Tax=Phytophthora infestans TaxID=4787 RepID=A0A833RN49_PHYIN|nr:hypothetical protein GN244_ATG19947 [Phytophthora infestans]